MPRQSDALHALKSALGNLWTLQELADEATRFEGAKGGLAVWRRNEQDCRRWVAVVAAGGRGGDLPPDLIKNRAHLNAYGWGIPEPERSRS